MAIAELSASASDTYIGGVFYMVWFEAGDSSHQCGYVISDDATSDEEVIVCATGGTPFAVTALQADLDIDTSVTAGTMYEYYALHAGTALRVGHDTDADATFKGTAFIRSAAIAGLVESGTTAGLVVGYGLKTYDVAADKYVELIT